MKIVVNTLSKTASCVPVATSIFSAPSQLDYVILLNQLWHDLFANSTFSLHVFCRCVLDRVLSSTLFLQCDVFPLYTRQIGLS